MSLSVAFLILSLVSAGFYLAVPMPVLAQPGVDPLQLGEVQQAIGGEQGLTSTNETRVIKDVFRFIFSLLAVVIVVALIWGGFLYLTSFGNEDKAKKGKQVLFYTIIGILLLGASFVIVEAVSSLFTA